jgi:hypothetical protein
LSLESLTTTPPDGAVVFNVTVAFTDVPPTTVFRAKVSEDSAGSAAGGVELTVLDPEAARAVAGSHHDAVASRPAPRPS